MQCAKPTLAEPDKRMEPMQQAAGMRRGMKDHITCLREHLLCLALSEWPDEPCDEERAGGCFPGWRRPPWRAGLLCTARGASAGWWRAPGWQEGKQDADAAKSWKAVPACLYICSGLMSEHPEGCTCISRQVSCPGSYERLHGPLRSVRPGACLLWSGSIPWQPRHAASQTQSASRTDCQISSAPQTPLPDRSQPAASRRCHVA